MSKRTEGENEWWVKKFKIALTTFCYPQISKFDENAGFQAVIIDVISSKL
jgi:hypothetical protein